MIRMQLKSEKVETNPEGKIQVKTGYPVETSDFNPSIFNIRSNIFGSKENLMKLNVKENIKLNNITNEQAWALGFFASDGSLVIPKTKGYYPVVSFCLNAKDSEVLEKIKQIYGCDHNVRLYEYDGKKTAHLSFTSSYYINLLNILNLKKCIPSQISNDKELFRHFARGLFDGDGCIHFRKRGGIILTFINEEESIVRDFSYCISKYTGIKFHMPKFVSASNLYEIKYESREGRILAWYLYRGNIKDASLKRKYDLYKSIAPSSNEITEFFECFYGKDKPLPLKEVNNGFCLSIPNGSSDYLAQAKIINNSLNAFNIKNNIVLIKKGQKQYYGIYITKDEISKIETLHS